MATIKELIWAYQYYKAPNLLISLNDVLKCRQHSRGKLSPTLLENIILGGHQHWLKHHLNVNYPNMKREVMKALTSPFPILSSPSPYVNFEDLYIELNKRLCPHGKFIKGISYLTLYDMALRIGYILLPKPILPEEKLYLYRGAFDGYCILQKHMAHLGLPSISKPGSYDMTIFKGVFNPIPSMYIEDLLCVYHKDFPYLTSMSFEDLQKKLSYGKNAPQIYRP